ncbi:MAG: molybdopterin-dependent oxidoreductase [Deltaproteobacteria bacterium]|nr:molybdopterin-dependent oxidoreductase [Deltaproteobacteria bacterium]
MSTMGQSRVVTTACVHDCGGKCLLRVHVRDGVITRITGDEGEEPQLRPCLKGRAYRQRIYHPDRLKYPQRRIGERGDGRFERISWDEALDTVAREMLRIKKNYGPEAILDGSGPANQSLLHGTSRAAVTRLLHMFGGCIGRTGRMSDAAAMAASQYTLGTTHTGSDPEDLFNSRLIILWAWNPAEAIHGTTTNWCLTRAKENGASIICIDPRYSRTAATWADQWIPIYPGTDAAMMAAMAHVMIIEGLHDRAFLDKYTVGFDAFRSYVLGREDGVPKTPVWAEAITGVSRDTIVQVARKYASTKPAALMAGWAMQRAAYGEQAFRASITLSAMTGNLGIPGGSAGGHYELEPCYPEPFGKFPVGPNPVGKTIPINKWADAILLGKAGGYPSDIKMCYITARNFLNQIPTVRKGITALKKLDFIAVHEQFMTPTALYADILLPVTTFFEREDICLTPTYAIYMNQAIEPLYECKSDLEILTDLAHRLGIEGYNDKSDEEWLRSFVPASAIPDFEAFKAKGIHHFRAGRPRVAFEAQVREPDRHRFSTPSGKIEIYSQQLADLNQPETIPPIPKYIEPWEGRRDPLTREFPLQLLTPHPYQFVHSSFTNVPWLQELERQQLWMNPVDAKARGIKPGEKVRVSNRRGALVVPALVTERIMPGVVSLDEGAWLNLDASGTDRGGSVNMLTRDEDTPLGDGATTHSCLVQVEEM